MKLICYLLATLLLLNSCTKNSNSNTYNFRGIVIDYSTGQRVSNANVEVRFTNLPNPRDTSSPDYSASTFSNSNGEFSLSLENNPTRNYYKVSGKKIDYASVDFMCGDLRSGLGRVLNMSNNPYFDTVYVDKSTVVNLNISNVSPANVNDTLELWIMRGMNCSPTIGQFRARELKLTGLIHNHFFSDTFSLKGTPSVKVEWNVKNNGVIATGSQNLNPTEFGVTNYNINY
jgi:hypothetical protein